MELVFATHNRHKLEEVRLLIPEKINLLSLEDIGCHEDIPETASTLEGNARIKANFIYNNYGYPCFADDTGLMVDALNGAPGVHSARYAGDQKSAADNVDKLLSELKDYPKRSARFITVIALRMKGKTEFFKGVVEGHITEEKRGNKGFGYDPVFIPSGYTQSFAEMTIQTKNEISHRGLALAQLSEYLRRSVSE